MKLEWLRYLSLPQIGCFDNDPVDDVADDSDPNAAAADDDAAKKAEEDRLLTQKQFNEALAKDRRKHQEQLKKVEKQYQDLLKKANLSAEERANLEEALEDVRKQARTKEQQAKFEKEQLEKTYSERIAELEKKAMGSEEKFVNMLVTRSLQDAAVAGDAFNPSQIIDILKPLVRLVDDKPMIDFPDHDKDTGEAIIAQMTPDEAIIRMKQLPEKYGNLFKANVVSGVGGTSNTGAMPGANGRVDVKKLTVEQYKELRKKNPAAVGL